MILGALPGSPAEECGLRYGDVLLSVNDVAMSTVEDFLQARAAASEKMNLIVRRSARVMHVTLHLSQQNRNAKHRAVDALERVQHLRLVPPPADHGPYN